MKAFFLLILIVLMVLHSKTEYFDETTTIPARFIQTSTSHHITNPVHVECITRLKKMHPSFEFMLFDDEEVDAFMETHFGEYSDFFRQRLKSRIQQIDFFRLCALFFYGGIYYDLDMYPLQPVTTLLSYKELILPVEYELSMKKCQQDPRFTIPCSTQRQKITIGNYAMASPPRNRHLKKLMDFIVDTFPRSFHRDGANDFFVEVYSTTGPDKITEFFYKDNEFRQNVHVLPRGSFYRDQEDDTGFGEFAEHLETGTWKNLLP